jgi:hypothetical protein
VTPDVVAAIYREKKRLGLVVSNPEKSIDCPLTNTLPAGGQHQRQRPACELDYEPALQSDRTVHAGSYVGGWNF